MVPGCFNQQTNIMTTIKTPADKKKALRKRLDKVLRRLPEKWISLFVFKYPAYGELKVHLSNVARGQSLDETVIEKMEQLAAYLTPDKQ